MNKKQINICKIPNSKKCYKISDLIYRNRTDKPLQFLYKASNVINAGTTFNLKK